MDGVLFSETPIDSLGGGGNIGDMNVNMSLGIRIMCGIPHCNGDFVVVATEVELYKSAI